MMMAIESSKLTRTQVHEKLKENFQALCTRCPQLVERKETLDDSLTNLQWLWNLNVNISNPVDGFGKSGQAGEDFFHNDGNVVTSRIFMPNRHPEQNNFRAYSNKPDKSKSKIATFSAKNSPSYSPPSSNDFQHRGACDLKPNDSAKSDLQRKPDKQQTNNHLKRNIEKATSRAKLARSLPNVKHEELINFIYDEKQNNSETSLSSDAYPLLSDAAFHPSTTNPVVAHAQTTSNSGPKMEYTKPSCSITTLILLALQQSRSGRLCMSSICQWIRENFPFYRNTTDIAWQRAVERSLKQNKFFTKVPRKKSQSRKILWEINRTQELNEVDFLTGDHPSVKVRGVTSPPSAIASANRIWLNSVSGFGLGRKRKQTTPQKVVRMRAAQKRRLHDAAAAASTRDDDDVAAPSSLDMTDADDRNPLREQAPELGSLKGDFNWNSIFDDLLGDESCLSDAANSSAGGRAGAAVHCHHHVTTSSGGFGAGAAGVGKYLNHAHAASASSHLRQHVADVNNENMDLFRAMRRDHFAPAGADSSAGVASSSGAGRHGAGDAATDGDDADMSKLLDNDALFRSVGIDAGGEPMDVGAVASGADDVISIEEFFHGVVGGLDLTVTGHQIAAPPEWIPVGADLDAILCENQDDNVAAIESPRDGARGL